MYKKEHTFGQHNRQSASLPYKENLVEAREIRLFRGDPTQFLSLLLYFQVLLPSLRNSRAIQACSAPAEVNN